MRTSIFIFLCHFSLAGFAQNSSSDAKRLLDDVSNKVKSYENIRIDFKYKQDEIFGSSAQETNGNAVLAGDKYILNVLGMSRIFDGSTLYTINPEDEEVTISSNNTYDDASISPQALLSFYEKGYAYKMDITQNVNGRKIQYVKLSPTDNATNLDYVLLGIDQLTHHIYNMIEISKDGSRTTLTVNSFRTNEPISKTLFTFDESKYESYFINRLD